MDSSRSMMLSLSSGVVQRVIWGMKSARRKATDAVLLSNSSVAVRYMKTAAVMEKKILKSFPIRIFGPTV